MGKRRRFLPSRGRPRDLRPTRVLALLLGSGEITCIGRLWPSYRLSARSGFRSVSAGASAKTTDAAPPFDPNNTASLEFRNTGAGHHGSLAEFDSFLICDTPECAQIIGRAHFLSAIQHSAHRDIPAGVTIIRGRTFTVRHRGAWSEEKSCNVGVEFTAALLHTYGVTVFHDETNSTCGVSVTDESSGPFGTTELPPWTDDRFGQP